MNRIFVITLLFLFVVGCKTGNDVPNGILPPEKMQYILWDMLQVDGLTTYSMDTMLRKPAKRMELYSRVLATHKISQEEFRKNMQFYESRPDLIKVVLDSLQQMSSRDTATIVIKERKPIADSIKHDTFKKINLDSLKARRPSIEKIKALKLHKPL